MKSDCHNRDKLAYSSHQKLLSMPCRYITVILCYEAVTVLFIALLTVISHPVCFWIWFSWSTFTSDIKMWCGIHSEIGFLFSFLKCRLCPLHHSKLPVNISSFLLFIVSSLKYGFLYIYYLDITTVCDQMLNMCTCYTLTNGSNL